MKYKYNKLLPLNIRIPFRWRDNKSYFTLSQFGDVNLEIKNIVDATLITYKKKKVKIAFRLKNDIRDYRIKFTNKKFNLNFNPNLNPGINPYFPQNLLVKTVHN